MKIYLIGLPVVGKTRIGEKLAKELDIEFIDLDEEIERLSGHHPAQLILDLGETYYRNLENEVLRRLTSRKGIIACGGGVVVTPKNKEYMNGFVVYMRIEPRNLRVSKRDLETRPILRERGLIELLAERETRYVNFSNAIVDIDHKEDSEVIEEIIKAYEDYYN